MQIMMASQFELFQHEMNVIGVPIGLGDTQMAVVLQNRRLNEEILSQISNGHEFVRLEGEPAARVFFFLHGSGVLFPSTALNLPRARFLATLDDMIADAVQARTAAEYTAVLEHAPVAEVPVTFGRQYILTEKLLANMESPPTCSICMETLIPEGSTKKKVWQLHGPQCSFHVGCIRRWFKQSSKCPNCNVDCAS